MIGARARYRRRGARATLGGMCAGIALATLSLGVVIAFGTHDAPLLEAETQPASPAPATVHMVAPRAEPIVLDGVIVRGATKGWNRDKKMRPVRAGDPVPVVLTSYCLSGTTRRGRYVRAGIVAADPRLFPLSRYVELYVGSKYLGRFLVDDTGSNIRGARIDVWLPTCRESVIFGRQRGTAVLVPRPEVQLVQAGAAK